MVENLPSNAGDSGLIPGGGTNIPHTMGQLSLHTATLHNEGAAQPKIRIINNPSVCVRAQSLSCIQLFVTPWTVAHQAPVCPWDFPYKNTGAGCCFLLQGDLPDPEIEPASWQADSFPLRHQGSLQLISRLLTLKKKRESKLAGATKESHFRYSDSPENLESLVAECLWEAVSVTARQLPFGSEYPVLSPGAPLLGQGFLKILFSLSIGLDLSTCIHVHTDSCILI